MANSKGINVQVPEEKKELIEKQLEQLLGQVEQKLVQYEKMHNKPFKIQLKETDNYDYINPNHYIQDDGRQTWEHMVDKFGLEKTAIFCELNAYKYSDRRGKKPGENTEREDKKIQWYDDKAKELYRLFEDEKNKKTNFFNLNN